MLLKESKLEFTLRSKLKQTHIQSFLFLLPLPGLKPRILYTLVKHSTTKLHPSVSQTSSWKEGKSRLHPSCRSKPSSIVYKQPAHGGATWFRWSLQHSTS